MISLTQDEFYVAWNEYLTLITDKDGNLSLYSSTR